MSDVLFDVRDLKRYFKSGKRTVKALDGVSFDLHQGETLSLVGESGCGKTTCARTLLGIYPATTGTVVGKNKDTSVLSRWDRTTFRKENQMIFQDPYAYLDPRMTVSEIIEEGMKRHFSYAAENRREIVQELLETVGLTAEFPPASPMSCPAASGSVSALPGHWHWSRNVSSATNSLRRWTYLFRPKLSIC